MSKVYLFGVGFDEKLVLRSVLRLGVKPGETALLIYSITASGEFEKTKVENALKNLRKILSDAGVNVVEIQIPATNLPSDVNAIVKELEERRPGIVVASLGSGMRYVAFVILYSCILYRDLLNKKAQIYIHAAREDGLYDITLSLNVFKTFLGSRELEALCVFNELGGNMARDELIKKLMTTLNIKQTPAYKLLNRMEEHGLITADDNRVELTSLGKSIAVVRCGSD